ncbi:MAG: hypothetical protein LR008_00580 [Candidatus Pacebacteria bacterium]|nr:hypothetical protein [Candidatus Paceibacterota bacterium]
MKTNGNDKTLESYKVFPIIAWVTTFLFAVFVYNITSDLKEITQELQQQTTQLQEQLNRPVDQIENFEV